MRPIPCQFVQDGGSLGRWAVYGFILVTAIHAALVYFHHAAAPGIHEKINVGIARGVIVTHAIEKATKELDADNEALSHSITMDIVSQVKRDLGLFPVTGTPFELRPPANVDQPIPSPVAAAPDDGPVKTDLSYHPVGMQAKQDPDFVPVDKDYSRLYKAFNDSQQPAQGNTWVCLKCKERNPAL